jgi:hypothetical protein
MTVETIGGDDLGMFDRRIAAAPTAAQQHG